VKDILFSRLRGRATDVGFTLIELVMVVALMALAGTLALVALVNYSAAQDHQGTADELVSDLRNAGQRAVTEGRTYCVFLDDTADTWTLYRTSCSAGTLVQGPTPTRGDITVGGLSIATTANCQTAGACIYFNPRGTATGGPTGLPSKVDVQRDGETAINVTVEGLTGRVDRS
jgi:prepilin-type N-terminal cleavage/methylation domain-containing protein